MKKQLFVAILLVLTTAITNAQTTPATLQWERSQNGVASTSNTFIKSKNDLSGNIYALSYSDADMLVVKFNSSGQVSQTYRYNNSSNANDYPFDFEVDASGYVYITGYSYIGSNYTMTVAKYNPNGTMMWELNYLPAYWVYPTSTTSNAMCLDNAGNVYFTGSMNDSLITVKANSSGVVQWATKTSVNGNYFGAGNDIAVDGFNSVYVTGKAKNVNGDFDAVAFKLNSSGVVQWTKIIAGLASGNDESINIGIDNSSNVYVSSNIADTSTTNFSVYLTKFNASGAQQWQKKIYNASQISSAAVKLIVDNVGNTYLGIHTSTSTYIGYAKIYKYTSSGTQLFATVIDDPLEDNNLLTDMYLDANAKIYTAGRFTFAGKLFANVLTSNGVIVNNLQINHNGALDFNSSAGIVAEQSGFFNIVTTAIQIYNERYSNSAVFQYEGVYAGNANTYDKAVKVIAQGSNSVYALGYVTNDISNVDAVLSKYDAEGNILWQNIIDNNLGNDYAYDMGKDSIFNIYLLKEGAPGSEIIKHDSIGSPIWTTTSIQQYRKIIVANGGNAYIGANSAESKRLIVGKVSVNGSILYESTTPVESDYQTYIGSINVNSTEEIVAAGHRYYNLGQPSQKLAIIVEKFSNAGSLQWHKEIPMIDSITNEALTGSYVSKVLIDVNDDIFVFGTHTTQANFGHTMGFLTKISSAGSILWSQFLDGNGGWHELSGDMRFLSNGQIVTYSGGNYNVLRKFNPNNGNIIWETTRYFGGNPEPKTLRVDANDDAFFTGQAVFSGISRDLILGKVNAAGIIKWVTSKAGASVGNDFAEGMDVTNTGRIYIVASMLNNSGYSNDFSILKFCDIAQPTLTTSNLTQNICPGSNVTLVAPASNSYLWSDGLTTNDSLITTTTGNYFCTVYKSDGCYKNTDTAYVLVKPLPTTPQICEVTVDSLSTHNIVFWDKSGITGASAFNIYREDLTNVYSYIGTVVYDSLSEFHDYGANPNTTTKRYKISAIDSCGQESSLSNYHNTLYIVSNGSGQFSWNPIYTIENSANPVNNYLLMRDDNSTGNWTQVASTAGTQFIINDVNYSSYPNGRWRVEAAWNITCTPTRGAINTTRSNIKSPTSIGITEVNSFNNLIITPNPANESITVSINSKEEKTKIEIYNTLGQKVIDQKVEGLETKIAIQDLQAGTYFVKVIGSQNLPTRKLIKY